MVCAQVKLAVKSVSKLLALFHPLQILFELVSLSYVEHIFQNQVYLILKSELFQIVLE